MHSLHKYVEKIAGLTDFVREVALNPAAQGVVLDVNPIWLTAYRIAHWDPGSIAFADNLSISETPKEADDIDFTWKAEKEWVTESTLRLLPRPTIREEVLPFLVKAIAKPARADLVKARTALVDLANEQAFLAVVETRPLGGLALAPGDPSLAGGVTGTIGGFLRDRLTGTTYAATCGHAASQGATVIVSGKEAGVCCHSHPPHAFATGQCKGQCAPCAESNLLDLALIDVTGAAVANTVTGIAPHVAPRQSIRLRGGVTGDHRYEVGGHLVEYKLDNGNICFKNLFEVRPRNAGGILNPVIRRLFAKAPTQGDSGAWVETVPSGEWCGVLVAADSGMGYALGADQVIEQAKEAFGFQLHLA